ncbi:phosphoadenosine phosphosulfate reductase [Actibacterium ureilyticum]|uniref:phosphoadenosine phosphosulfate reductase n=1 Tax=Actibacterium ureilyticum TaxID=1590614 RepID=UPI000BAB00F9|nr:phosphoadenosine phosphosulfate reductase [Actibacterium ureilyticum]
MQVGNDGTAAGEWYSSLARSVDGTGGIESLGNGYSALTSRQSHTLLVTFESVDKILAHRPEQTPLAAALADESGMSFLTLLSERRAWYRDPVVYAYFDRLIDEGYFDTFDRVVFYGAGMCGYAAAAYSVAAPGATVIAVNPVATLDPSVTGWDRRYFRYRRLNFTTRYGYGPEMIEAAAQAFVLFDPYRRPDAMHAALYTNRHVHMLRCRHLGKTLETDLAAMGILDEVLDAACEGQLTPQIFHRLYRARRGHAPYYDRLRAQLEAEDRPYLTALLSRVAAAKFGQPADRERFDELEELLLRQGRSLPGTPAGAKARDARGQGRS